MPISANLAMASGQDLLALLMEIDSFVPFGWCLSSHAKHCYYNFKLSSCSQHFHFAKLIESMQPEWGPRAASCPSSGMFAFNQCCFREAVVYFNSHFHWELNWDMLLTFLHPIFKKKGLTNHSCKLLPSIFDEWNKSFQAQRDPKFHLPSETHSDCSEQTSRFTNRPQSCCTSPFISISHAVHSWNMQWAGWGPERLSSVDSCKPPRH